MIELENGNTSEHHGSSQKQSPVLEKHTKDYTEVNKTECMKTYVLGHERFNYLNMKVGTFGWVCWTQEINTLSSE